MSRSEEEEEEERKKKWQHVKDFSDLFKTKYVRDEDRLFMCTVCEEVREDEEDLVKHFLAHTEQKSNVCEHCLMGFNTEPELQQHLRVKHNPQVRIEFFRLLYLWN
jgi:Zinc finger, C2H2 type